MNYCCTLMAATYFTNPFANMQRLLDFKVAESRYFIYI